MSNRATSKKAQKNVTLAKRSVTKSLAKPKTQISSSTGLESYSHKQESGGSKRPADETKVSPPKRICQDTVPSGGGEPEELSLDYIISDDENNQPIPCDNKSPPVSTKKASSIQKKTTPLSARSVKPPLQPLRGSTRHKKLESVPFLRGFKNLGNTCYMNAVLQALLSLSPFQSDLQKFYSSLSQLSSAKISPGLIEAFVDIMGQVNTESNSINAFNLKAAVSQQEKRFADFRQQDAHEFFLCLLDQISDEVAETMKAASRQSGQQHEHKDFCPTTKNFDCLVEHSLTCRQCGDTTRVTELYRDFSLEVPLNLNEPQFAEFKPSLQNLMEAFFSTDEVDRRCEKCGAGRAVVSHQILQLPRILVLHLKRFRLDFKRSTYTKITRKVLINPELDISFCCSTRVQSPPASPDPNFENSVSKSPVVFDLHCITHHIGRYATAGHYISDVRVSSRGDDQRWYSYNDTIVTEISANEALNEERESYGYMFFYLLRTD